jgi:hypothetical protein
MERSLRCVRRPWRAFACAALACALVACGGGGDGGANPPDDGGGQTHPESGWLLAEFVARDTNGQFIRVWDPAHPEVAIQQVPIVAVNGIVWQSSHLVFSDATRYDAATRTVKTLGHAKAFFDSGGHVWSIDLRGGKSHLPVQVSSVADATSVKRVWALDAAGDDAWLEVEGGLHGWAVRTTMASPDPAVSISGIPAALRDEAGLPQYFLVGLGGRSETNPREITYEVRTPALETVAVPALATMNDLDRDAWLGADPTRPGLAYIRLDGEVRTLRWSASGASVDAGSVMALAHPIELTAATVGADAVYIGDGNVLLALADGRSTRLGELSYAARELVDAGPYLAATEFDFHQPAGLCCNVIESLRKVDGVVEPLAAAEQLVLLGASGERLVYAEGPLAEGPQGFTLLAGDGSGRVDVAGTWVALVRADTARVDQAAAATALLTCPTSNDRAGFCSAGTLTQVDIASGASTALGTLAPSRMWMQGLARDAVAGLPYALAGQTTVDSPEGFGARDTDGRDAWQFTPGVAGSLARVTANLP